MFGRASIVGMLENIAGPVNTRPLAIPHAKDAIIFGIFIHVDLLAAPNNGGGKVFVDACLKFDLLFGQEFLGPPKLLIKPAQRRSAISGNTSGSIKARARVKLSLHQGQPDQRLNAGKVNPAFFKCVFVVELNCRQLLCHDRSPSDLSDMRGHLGPYALLLLIWVLAQCFGMTLKLYVRSGMRDLRLILKW